MMIKLYRPTRKQIKKEAEQRLIRGHFDDSPPPSRYEQQKTDQHRDSFVGLIEFLILLAILVLLLANIFGKIYP